MELYVSQGKLFNYFGGRYLYFPKSKPLEEKKKILTPQTIFFFFFQKLLLKMEGQISTSLLPSQGAFRVVATGRH